jgi:hypothetical protein
LECGGSTPLSLAATRRGASPIADESALEKAASSRRTPRCFAHHAQGRFEELEQWARPAYDFAEKPSPHGDLQMDEPRITPSRWYYVLAGLVFVGGMALFAWFLFKSLSGMGDKLQQVVAPGDTDLTLREPGNYTIFYEYQSVVGDKVYSTGQSISGLSCALVAKTTNSKIPLSRSSMNSSYVLNGRSGRSIFDFRIDQPGVYALSATYPQGQQGPEIVLAVGKDFTAGLFLTILRAFALFFGSIGIAVAIMVVTLVRRIKNKELHARARVIMRPTV